MKKLTCEMCESTDFIKQDGAFVCQSCGLKYSTEEAKKIMTEDQQNNGSSNAPASNSSKLDNLYLLARRARNENNTEKAAQYYEQILPEDPNNWEATFYAAYYTAIQKWRNNEKGVALSSLRNCISNAMVIVKEYCDKDNTKVAISEMDQHINSICSAFHNANASDYDSFCNRHPNLPYDDSTFRQHKDKITAINQLIGNIYYTFGAGLLDLINDNNFCLIDLIESKTKIAMDNAITRVEKNPCGYVSNTCAAYRERDALINASNKILSQLKEIKCTLAKKRFNDYWATHKDEKTALESEKLSLTQQIMDINAKEIPAIPGYAEMKKFENDIESLIGDKKSLGIFKSKEKKAIQQKIDAINAELVEIRAKVNQDLEKIQKRISEHKDRINTIDAELTKPR